MIILAEKKRAARSAASVGSRTKSIPDIVAGVRISALAKIQLVIARNRSHARVLKVDDLASSDHARHDGNEAQKFDYG